MSDWTRERERDQLKIGNFDLTILMLDSQQCVVTSLFWWSYVWPNAQNELSVILHNCWMAREMKIQLKTIGNTKTSLFSRISQWSTATKNVHGQQADTKNNKQTLCMFLYQCSLSFILIFHKNVFFLERKINT